MKPEERCQSVGDAAAYALGALEPQEAEDFLRHAESCVVCRDELDEFRRTVGTLALGVPQYEAPPRLRDAVMREVEADARLRETSDSSGVDSSSRRGPAWRLGPRPARRWPGGWAPGPLLGGALVIIVVALAVVVGVRVGQTHVRATRTISADVFGSSIRAELRIESGHAELVVDDLPQPSAGHIYELWLKRGRTVQPSSLFSPLASGHDVVEVPGSLASVSAVMVTLEPASGVAHPTTQPLILAKTHA